MSGVARGMLFIAALAALAGCHREPYPGAWKPLAPAARRTASLCPSIAGVFVDSAVSQGGSALNLAVDVFRVRGLRNVPLLGRLTTIRQFRDDSLRIVIRDSVAGAVADSGWMVIAEGTLRRRDGDYWCEPSGINLGRWQRTSQRGLFTSFRLRHRLARAVDGALIVWSRHTYLGSFEYLPLLGQEVQWFRYPEARLTEAAGR